MIVTVIALIVFAIVVALLALDVQADKMQRIRAIQFADIDTMTGTQFESYVSLLFQ